jgi:hypothetical protein
MPNIITMMKSRRMRWAGHVACMGDKYISGLGWNREEKRPGLIWEYNIKQYFHMFMARGNQ